MTTNLPAKVISMLFALSLAGNADEEKFSESMERVLTVDFFELAKSMGDTSEAGQNEAAMLQVEARRIRTESRLAKQSMRRVVVMAYWRRALNLWYDAQYDMIYLLEGGGTMWFHIMARNDIEVEEFLEEIADLFPTESAEVPEAVGKRLRQLIEKTDTQFKNAEAAAKKHGTLDAKAIKAVRTRLDKAQMELQNVFRHAGDKETAEKILAECSRYVTSFDEVINVAE